MQVNYLKNKSVNMQTINYKIEDDLLFLYENKYEDKYAFMLNYSSHVQIELSNDFNILSVSIKHATEQLNIPPEILIQPDNIELFIEYDKNNELILSLEIESNNRKYMRKLKKE